MDAGGSKPRKERGCGREERKVVHSGVPKEAVLWPNACDTGVSGLWPLEEERTGEAQYHQLSIWKSEEWFCSSGPGLFRMRGDFTCPRGKAALCEPPA